MNDLNNIKRLLRPLFYGWYLIAFCFIVAILIAIRALNYASPVYQSTVKLKLDDLYEGVSNSNLFKDFDVFSTSNKILGEVEVIKSKVLIEKTLEKLDFDVSYFRLGTVAKKEIYHEAPFQVIYSNIVGQGYDRPFVVEITEKKKTLKYMKGEEELVFPFHYNDTVKTEYGNFLIIERDINHCDKNKGACLGIFEFTIHSINEQINSIIGSNLTVMEIDKDVAIVRITYKSEVAEKSALFSNTLAEVYIDDFIQNKIKAAGKTIDFVSERLDNVGKRLAASERNLERYRLNNRVVNLLQESETGLRQIAQMKVQLANLEAEAGTLDTLYQYTRQGSGKILEMAPSFESIGGLLYTEMVKTLRSLEADKKDLLLKYKPEHKDVININQKIADVEHYMLQNIENHRNELMIKIGSIREYLSLFESQFDDYATKEKNVIVLERRFKQDERTFNFLTQKKTEAEIVQRASIAFHRIIEYAKVPNAPISPNKKFMVIVAGFLGLIIGVFLAFTRSYMLQRVYDKHDLEGCVRAFLPVDTLFIKKLKDKKMLGWRLWAALKHHLRTQEIKGVIYFKNAGRHNGSEVLANAFHEVLKNEQIKICQLSLNGRFDTNIDDEAGVQEDRFNFISDLPVEAFVQTARFREVINKLRTQYELIVITSKEDKNINDMDLLRTVDYSVIVSRNKKTSKKVINTYERAFDSFQVKEVNYTLIKDDTGWHHKIINFIKRLW